MSIIRFYRAFAHLIEKLSATKLTRRFIGSAPAGFTLLAPTTKNWAHLMGMVFFLYGFFPGLAGAEPPRGLETLLKTAEGKTLRLADFHGKVVLVNFWATWCPPCLQEIPELISFQNTYAAKGVVVVGINFMDQISRERLLKFKVDKKINYPLVYGEPDKLGKLANDLGGVLGLPVSKLLNRKGQVVASHVGGLNKKDLQTLVEPLLTPPQLEKSAWK